MLTDVRSLASWQAEIRALVRSGTLNTGLMPRVKVALASGTQPALVPGLTFFPAATETELASVDRGPIPVAWIDPSDGASLRNGSLPGGTKLPLPAGSHAGVLPAPVGADGAAADQAAVDTSSIVLGVCLASARVREGMPGVFAGVPGAGRGPEVGRVLAVRPPPVAPLFPADEELNDKIILWQGDITKLKIDAVVNAANEALAPGGGICGALHRAAGPQLARACSKIGRCKTGNTVATPGFKLPSKWVLHTVGPVGELPAALRSCYVTTLDRAVDVGARSVALCCVSTGIFGYPNQKAAEVAVRAVREWMQGTHRVADGGEAKEGEGEREGLAGAAEAAEAAEAEAGAGTDAAAAASRPRRNADLLDHVVFCVFLDKDLNIYRDLLPRVFPDPAFGMGAPSAGAESK